MYRNEHGVKCLNSHTVSVRSKNNAFLQGIIHKYFPPCKFKRQEKVGKNLRLVYEDYKREEYKMIIPS